MEREDEFPQQSEDQEETTAEAKRPAEEKPETFEFDDWASI